MQRILLFCLYLVASQAVPQGLTIDKDLNEEWQAYKIKYGRQYDPLTELTRRIIWEENLRYIQQHNIEQDLGKHTYTLGLNEYADMTNEEFKAKYLGIKRVARKPSGSHFLAPENIGDALACIDWRLMGYVTPVKNQQQCGSCWAFSATGSLEGQHFRKTGNLISLSEQQLVDCSGAFGNYGCRGGLMDNAFRYIAQYGIESEADYPYTATDGNCKYDKSKVVATLTGYFDIPSGNETILETAVRAVGPVSVAIDASHNSFRFYKNGIYNEPQCSQTALDHGVLAIGYCNVRNGKNYWIVKNSWGTSWGLSGYIQMSKDANNQCGIATMASFPIV